MPPQTPNANTTSDRSPEESRRAGAVALPKRSQNGGSVEAVVRANIEATTDYTRGVLQRNVELAADLVPAYIDAYERTLKRVGDLWTETGQAVVRVGEAGSLGPKVMASSLAEAGEALSAIPQTVGNAVAGASRTLVRAPQSVGEQVREQVRESVPALVGAPARFLTETAEVTSAAVRHGLIDKAA